MINEYVMIILYSDYDKCLFLIEDKDIKITNVKIRAHNLLKKRSFNNDLMCR